MSFPIAISLLVAFALGAALAWLFSRSKAAAQVADVERELALARQELSHLAEDEARLKAAMKEVGSEALEDNRKTLLDEFEKKSIAAKGELEKRELAVKNLVDPIEARLQEVGKQIKEIEKERKEAQGGLVEQLKSLSVDQKNLQRETNELVNALKRTSTRGKWGELQLRRVVEMANMIEYCDFVTQVDADKDGTHVRPDMVIKLPGGQEVLVDAKTPMESWLNAQDASGDEERKRLLQAHAKSVRGHIASLSKKSYWEYSDKTPEFVIMFLPNEAIFSSALQTDPQLIEEGVAQKVILATPTTLIALLRAVAFGWQQTSLTENAEKISKLGYELYERLGKLGEHFTSLGRSLDRSVEHFNKAVGSLENRVLVSARKFPALGVGSDELAAIDPIDKSARALQAPDLEEGE